MDTEEGEDEVQKEEDESSKDQPGMEPKVTSSSFRIVVGNIKIKTNTKKIF